MFCPGCKERKALELAGLKLERMSRAAQGGEGGEQVSGQPGLGAGLVAGPGAGPSPPLGLLSLALCPSVLVHPHRGLLRSRGTLQLSGPLPLTLRNTLGSETA